MCQTDVSCHCIASQCFFNWSRCCTLSLWLVCSLSSSCRCLWLRWRPKATVSTWSTEGIDSSSLCTRVWSWSTHLTPRRDTTPANYPSCQVCDHEAAAQLPLNNSVVEIWGKLGSLAHATYTSALYYCQCLIPFRVKATFITEFNYWKAQVVTTKVSIYLCSVYRTELND